MANQFGGPSRRGRWILVLWGHSPWSPSIPSSSTSLRLCEIERNLQRMDGLCPVALVCLGHYYLQALLSPFSPRWWLLGPPPECLSWFCLVRHSTAATKVWTCLLRAVVCGSSPWILLVVTIERVNTIQLFVREMIVWLYKSKFPTDGANW